MDEIKKLSEMANRPELPSSFQVQDVSQMASTLPALFNTLVARRSIIPAANAHCSARALARYYAALVDRGTVPPPHAHSSPTHPRLGSHPHTPKFPSLKPSKKQKKSDRLSEIVIAKDYTRVPSDDGLGNVSTDKIFGNARIHDAFMGVGEYEDLVLSGGQFGLGFKRSYSEGGELIGFGHSGMGGSTGYCDVKNRFAIAVTLNKMNFGGVTAKVMKLVCSELDIPLPADFYRFTERISDDIDSNLAAPLIN